MGLILSIYFFYLFDYKLSVTLCQNSIALFKVKIRSTGHPKKPIWGLYYQYCFFTFSPILRLKNMTQRSDIQFLVDVPSRPYFKDVDK